VSNTMSVVRTARLAIRPRTSMPAGGRAGLIGATRRKPRAARRGMRSGERHNEDERFGTIAENLQGLHRRIEDPNIQDSSVPTLCG
jgi:hypothetical protein